MDYRTIPAETLTAFAVGFLRAKGASEEDARYIAQMAITTEAMGVHTHGLALLPYFEGAIPENLNPQGVPRIVKQRGAVALIDADSAFPQLALRLAKATAVTKAREQGVAMVSVRNTPWIGAVGVYLISLAQEGFFAQLWAQTSTCLDCAPFGGVDGTFSTNPVGFAFPAADLPVISDFSTAFMSLGKANTLIATGEDALEEAFLDKDGVPTNDPSVLKEGGTLLFFGGKNYGYKGYGMSLWCEALTAMAGGSANNPEAPTRQTISLTVIDPDAFEGTDYYYREIDRFLQRVRSSRLRPGYDRIRLPGERGLKQLAISETEGVEVTPEMVGKLNELAERYGLQRL